MTPISPAAEVQRRLWGTDPQAWADLAESHNQPLFEAVLDAARVGPGTRLLDVGCGSGLTLVLAAQRGAIPSGLDVSPGLLAIARKRLPGAGLPGADLRDGDMESLPFADASFDAVTGVNAFQFAGDPRRALSEAARVLRPGGRVVASLFAEPERSQGTVAHEAMTALIPPERVADHAPYALSAPGNLESALVSAGLTLDASGEVVCPWHYASMDEALRALLCSAGGARAAEAAGPDAVREALKPALAQFQDPADGTVTMVNTFRWVAARSLPFRRRSQVLAPAQHEPQADPDHVGRSGGAARDQLQQEHGQDRGEDGPDGQVQRPPAPGPGRELPQRQQRLPRRGRGRPGVADDGQRRGIRIPPGLGGALGHVGVSLAARPRGAQFGERRRRGGIDGQVTTVRPVRVSSRGDRPPRGPDLLIGQVRADGQPQCIERVHSDPPGPKTSSRSCGSGQTSGTGTGSRRGSGTRLGSSSAGVGGIRVSGEGFGRATWTKVAAPRWM
jgi:SAM-dependent methyltransferase